MTLLLDGSGSVFIAAGWFVVLAHRSPRTAAGLFAVGNGLFAVADFVSGERLAACVASAVCACCVWAWWNRGGGDGMKRRLRSAWRRFAAVRRTAPVYGGAP